MNKNPYVDEYGGIEAVKILISRGWNMGAICKAMGYKAPSSLSKYLKKHEYNFKELSSEVSDKDYCSKLNKNITPEELNEVKNQVLGRI